MWKNIFSFTTFVGNVLHAEWSCRIMSDASLTFQAFCWVDWGPLFSWGKSLWRLQQLKCCTFFLWNMERFTSLDLEERQQREHQSLQKVLKPNHQQRTIAESDLLQGSTISEDTPLLGNGGCSQYGDQTGMWVDQNGSLFFFLPCIQGTAWELPWSSSGQTFSGRSNFQKNTMGIVSTRVLHFIFPHVCAFHT